MAVHKELLFAAHVAHMHRNRLMSEHNENNIPGALVTLQALAAGFVISFNMFELSLSGMHGWAWKEELFGDTWWPLQTLLYDPNSPPFIHAIEPRIYLLGLLLAETHKLTCSANPSIHYRDCAEHPSFTVSVIQT